MHDDVTATEAKPAGKREQNRIERTRRFLDTALDLVTTEGFDGLTMQRLADATESAIGAVYRYFPSKGALVAEVQREAIERLATSYALIRARSDVAFRDAGLDDGDFAVARLVLFGRYFTATADTFPQELRLLQMLMGEWRAVVPVEEALRVVPSAMRLLDQARQCIDDAVAVGVLDGRAAPMARTVTWAAAVAGAMQLSRLDVFDADLFDGQALGRALTLDLFRAWGAPEASIERAVGLVDDLARSGPLAPPLDDRA